jgi:prepilin-type N-terminal cleavage/methylation domain-containing protein
MNPSSPAAPRRRHTEVPETGFTLIEVLITLGILALVAGALMVMTNLLGHGKQATQNAAEATQAAQAALDMMAEELRSAGYGADLDFPGGGQPAIAYVDSAEVILAANYSPWPDSTTRHGGPQSYDPAGSPRPRTLDATQWQPAQKFRTGAELVRYTLDANNDGIVDANDQSSALGSDARRTTNPDDYMLLRQVYGDSTGNVAHDNGGQTQSVALVSRPGAGVPPMFTVYLRGSSTPWDWANGAVPPNRLADIERISLQVTATSPQPDARGRYARATLRTEVNSTRNQPAFLTSTYGVDGYVFDDANQNQVKDNGEAGIPGVSVRTGNVYSTTTNASGYYLMRVPAGTYTLKHVAVAGYASITTPDSFVVSVGPGVTRSFADMSLPGGHVTVHCFDDLDGNGVQDPGERSRAFEQVTCSPGGATASTDLSGNATLFASAGGYAITVSVPDSLQCTTTNPISGVMVNGANVSVTFGLKSNPNGVVRGRVFIDTNRNGVQDGGELGSANTWVGVVNPYTGAIVGFGNTDAGGGYSVNVPANNPPMTTPYFVYFLPPAGFFPTTSQAWGPLWLGSGQVVTGQNFGVAAFLVISLSASRVLSLAAADLVENDWGNNSANARGDLDILLGADAGGSDNISVWFNQYNATTVFNTSPLTPAGSGYTRNAPQSVLSIAVDTLDSNAPVTRPDVVTGTKLAATGNFFVWLNQNSSGNQGYLPATFSPAQNYTTLDAGDVSSVVTLDCSGGGMPDLIVGTRSPLAGHGTVEIWQNSNTATPTFVRQEVYPVSGGVPGNSMGEVAAMALGDLDGDGLKDLVVVTRTGSYDGELLVFRNTGRTNGSRFRCDFHKNLQGDVATSVCVTDVTGDGWKDIVIGTQSGVGTGHLLLWRNVAGHNLDFSWDRQVSTPGPVMSVAAADFGGSGRNDIAVGWRRDDTSYVGGVLIYFTDSGTIPNTGSDPSNGSIASMAPAITTGNFNYGVRPSVPLPPFLQDLAVGVKTSATTGALVLFIR